MKIPKGWRLEALSWAVAKLESGVSENGSNRGATADEPAVLKVSAVTSGCFEPNYCKALPQLPVLRSRTAVKGDCVLVNRANGSAALVGVSVYVAKPYPLRFLPDKIWQITANKERAHARYLGLLTSTPRFRGSVLDRSSGGTGMRNIGSSRYLEIEALFPPLSEQLKIADILGTWDEALEKLDALIAAKERRKQGLMQQLLTGKRRLLQFTEPWRWLRLDELCARIERKAPVGIDRVLSITAGAGFQDQREKFSRVIAGRNIENYIHLKRGEFSYNKGNSNLYPQGCIYRLEEYEEGAVPNVWVSFAVKSKNLDSNFLKQYFLAGGHNHQLSRLINFGVRNDGLLNLTADSFFSIKIPVPSLEEQHRLGTLFEGLAEELSLLRNQRAALDEQKRGLMQQLLTGKVRVS